MTPASGTMARAMLMGMFANRYSTRDRRLGKLDSEEKTIHYCENVMLGLALRAARDYAMRQG